MFDDGAASGKAAAASGPGTIDVASDMVARLADSAAEIERRASCRGRCTMLLLVERVHRPAVRPLACNHPSGRAPFVARRELIIISEIETSRKITKKRDPKRADLSFSK
jgi:hypothetical protein